VEESAQAALEWRDRAIALRALAKYMTHPTARSELMEVADRWDMRAQSANTGPFLLRLFSHRRPVDVA
jgi:hypothetical protein